MSVVKITICADVNVSTSVSISIIRSIAFSRQLTLEMTVPKYVLPKQAGQRSCSIRWHWPGVNLDLGVSDCEVEDGGGDGDTVSVGGGGADDDGFKPSPAMSEHFASAASTLFLTLSKRQSYH